MKSSQFRKEVLGTKRGATNAPKLKIAIVNYPGVERALTKKRFDIAIWDGTFDGHNSAFVECGLLTANDLKRRTNLIPVPLAAGRYRFFAMGKIKDVLDALRITYGDDIYVKDDAAPSKPDWDDDRMPWPVLSGQWRSLEDKISYSVNLESVIGDMSGLLMAYRAIKEEMAAQGISVIAIYPIPGKDKTVTLRIRTLSICREIGVRMAVEKMRQDGKIPESLEVAYSHDHEASRIGLIGGYGMGFGGMTLLSHRGHDQPHITNGVVGGDIPYRMIDLRRPLVQRGNPATIKAMMNIFEELGRSGSKEILLQPPHDIHYPYIGAAGPEMTRARIIPKDPEKVAEIASIFEANGAEDAAHTTFTAVPFNPPTEDAGTTPEKDPT